MTGRILKGVGGFYYVRTAGGKIYECRARGKFRLEDVKPMPGDMVEFTPQQQGQGGSVDHILPRKNSLVRPMVANIDLLLVVIAATKPKADLLLVDKLLLYARYCGIPAALAANKADAGPQAATAILKEYAGSGAARFAVSAKTGEGLGELEALLQGKCTCLAGQSAVGKSSLLNALEPGIVLETGGLSRKTDRGRHTTRHAELIPLERLQATVVDTPGFSILEAMDVEPEALSEYYPEFSGGCRFAGCLHRAEPDCAVKAALDAGAIPQGRYARYITILEEIMERKEHRYD